MYERKLPVELDCGLHLFMEVLNGKWKLPLIWSIHSGIRRPGALHRKLSRASRRLLDSQLSQLVAQGILVKTSVAQKPLKVEYQLTALGESLIPVIELTAHWGEAHREVLELLFTNKQSASS